MKPGIRAHFLLAGLGLASVLATPASARLGETLAQLTERFGKPAGTPKGTAYWLFEVGDVGQVQYTVTFGEEKKSIAEGLRPLRNTAFTANVAQDFIASQLAALPESPARRIVTPGEKYEFAGEVMVCNPNEYVIVDPPHNLLIVWSRANRTPYVLVLSPEMMRLQAKK